MTSDLSKTGILLLSHGSRLDQGKKVIEAYTQMYKEEFPEAIVEYGFMEMREPNIPQSINKLTNGNDLEKIIVVPVFVAHGLHTRRDIPKLLGIENDFDESEISGGHHEHHHDHGHHHHHHHDHDHDDEETFDFDMSGKLFFAKKNECLISIHSLRFLFCFYVVHQIEVHHNFFVLVLHIT